MAIKQTGLNVLTSAGTTIAPVSNSFDLSVGDKVYVFTQGDSESPFPSTVVDSEDNTYTKIYTDFIEDESNWDLYECNVENADSTVTISATWGSSVTYRKIFVVVCESGDMASSSLAIAEPVLFANDYTDSHYTDYTQTPFTHNLCLSFFSTWGGVNPTVTANNGTLEEDYWNSSDTIKIGILSDEIAWSGSHAFSYSFSSSEGSYGVSFTFKYNDASPGVIPFGGLGTTLASESRSFVPNNYKYNDTLGSTYSPNGWVCSQSGPIHRLGAHIVSAPEGGNIQIALYKYNDGTSSYDLIANTDSISVVGANHTRFTGDVEAYVEEGGIYTYSVQADQGLIVIGRENIVGFRYGSIYEGNEVYGTWTDPLELPEDIEYGTAGVMTVWAEADEEDPEPEPSNAPTLTSQTGISLGTTTVTPQVTTDTPNGTAYFVVFLQSEDDPTSEQIAAGLNAENDPAISSGSKSVTEAGVIIFDPVTGLNPKTAYRIGYTHLGLKEE